MKQISIWVTILAVIAAFAGGFWLANYLNRFEISSLRSSGEQSRSALEETSKSTQELTLSNEEIDTKLREAEQNAENFSFQKGLGLGLYRYGAMKQDKTIIERSVPVLERANLLDPNDVDVLVGLGNAYFDIGYFGKENKSLETARTYYTNALAKRPGDVEIRTDLGLTYFLQQPPKYNEALAEFERSLAIDPKHEKTLDFTIRSLSGLGKDNKDYVERLRAINPNSAVLKDPAARTTTGAER